MSGKGSRPRPVDGEKYRANWPLGPSQRERRAALYDMLDRIQCETVEQLFAHLKGYYEALRGAHTKGGPAHTKGGDRS